MGYEEDGTNHHELFSRIDLCEAGDNLLEPSPGIGLGEADPHQADPREASGM